MISITLSEQTWRSIASSLMEASRHSVSSNCPFLAADERENIAKIYAAIGDEQSAKVWAEIANATRPQQ